VRKQLSYEPAQSRLVIFKFYRLKLKTKVLHTDYHAVVEVVTAIHQEHKQSGVPRSKLLIAFVGIMDGYKEFALLCK